MAGPRFYDRVKETTVSPGIGTINLSGAPVGYRAFGSVFSSGDLVPYCMATQNGPEWEVGLCTYINNSLGREASLIKDSSSGVGILANFSSGTQDVFCDLTAYHANELTSTLATMWVRFQ